MSLYSDGLTQLLDVLPGVVRERLERSGDLHSLVEVVLDYGRPAEARYRDRVERFLDITVSELDLEYVEKSIGAFGSDNRAGIERTLHRISAIRNRHGKVVGLTCRVGRALEGTIDMIDDIVRSGKSVLLLGRPGVGKTTKLREIARVLADEVGRRVVIVDTSNEIAGDGDVPHPGIGFSRRMQVRHAAEQHQVMIEAVENHMPEVIVIDEIGTEAEAFASRTIAERGVQLVGTAHGQTLENLMLNPTLADLIGGIQAVTLSDAEAQRRGTQKTVLERKAPPTFDVVIELLDYDRLAVHHNVLKTVDMILRGIEPRPEIRVRTSGGVEVVQAEQTADLTSPGFNDKFPSLARKPLPENARVREPRRNDFSKREGARVQSPKARGREETAAQPGPSEKVRIFTYGVEVDKFERLVAERNLPYVRVESLDEADAVLTQGRDDKGRPKRVREALGRSLITVNAKSNSAAQLKIALDDLERRVADKTGTEGEGLAELEKAVEVVTQTGKPFELAPAPANVRKLQHRAAEMRKFASESVGQEPNRRLRLLPTRL